MLRMYLRLEAIISQFSVHNFLQPIFLNLPLPKSQSLIESNIWSRFFNYGTFSLNLLNFGGAMGLGKK